MGPLTVSEEVPALITPPLPEMDPEKILGALFAMVSVPDPSDTAPDPVKPAIVWFVLLRFNVPTTLCVELEEKAPLTFPCRVPEDMFVMPV